MNSKKLDLFISDELRAFSFDFNPSRVSVIWVLWFFLCLYPITINGFGVNYLFVMTPIISLFLGQKIVKPNKLILLFMGLGIVIFASASFYQINLYGYAIRRVISFILFMSIVAFSFIDLTPKKFNSFILSICFISCFFSINSIYNLVVSGLISNAYEAKDVVGSQRYGFMIVFAFWAILSCWSKSKTLNKIFIIFVSFLIISGLVITFSRSSIVALLASFVFFLIYGDQKKKNHRVFTFNLKNIKRIVGCVVIAFFLLYIVKMFTPSIFEFFNIRLFKFFVSGQVFENLQLQQTSEGTRLLIWSEVFEYVISNPLLGSGFLGSWIFGEGFGSSHNQYVDALLRLGFVGFIVYIYLYWRLIALLLSKNRLLLAGFVGVLAYGMFHETFKEPYGSALLAFLLSCYSSEMKQNENLKLLKKNSYSQQN